MTAVGFVIGLLLAWPVAYGLGWLVGRSRDDRHRVTYRGYVAPPCGSRMFGVTMNRHVPPYYTTTADSGRAVVQRTEVGR